jgi:hypothetical protein
MLPSKRQREAESAHARPYILREVNQKAEKFSTNNGIFTTIKEKGLKLHRCEQNGRTVNGPCKRFFLRQARVLEEASLRRIAGD